MRRRLLDENGFIITITLGEHVTSITVRINNGVGVTYNSNTIIKVKKSDSVSWTSSCESGYETTNGSGSFSNIQEDKIITVTASLIPELTLLVTTKFGVEKITINSKFGMQTFNFDSTNEENNIHRVSGFNAGDEITWEAEVFDSDYFYLQETSGDIRMNTNNDEYHNKIAPVVFYTYHHTDEAIYFKGEWVIHTCNFGATSPEEGHLISSSDTVDSVKTLIGENKLPLNEFLCMGAFRYFYCVYNKVEGVAMVLTSDYKKAVFLPGIDLKASNDTMTYYVLSHYNDANTYELTSFGTAGLYTEKCNTSFYNSHAGTISSGGWRNITLGGGVSKDTKLRLIELIRYRP